MKEKLKRKFHRSLEVEACFKNKSQNADSFVLGSTRFLFLPPQELFSQDGRSIGKNRSAGSRKGFSSDVNTLVIQTGP